MGIPMDYGAYAPTYACVRFAVPWIMAPLEEEVGSTRPGARIVEIGCGTGNYVEADDTFFAEIGRVLADGGVFVAATDSEENMQRRSLTHFFPEVLAVEQARYPSLETLDVHASAAGLARTATSLAEGHVELDDAFVAKLEAKCSSAMRLIDEAAHRRGIAQVRAARERGERWLSSYSMLVYRRA
jgi:SAM-dependent methyltransferase